MTAADCLVTKAPQGLGFRVSLRMQSVAQLVTPLEEV